jgi:lysophospholipase L1-like esterase
MMSRKRRLLAATITFVVLLGGLLAYLYLFIQRPVGQGAAGPAISRELFASPWTDRPILLVGLGDSVTAGFGAAKGNSYFERLVVNPPGDPDDVKGLSLTAVLPKLEYKNFSVSGTTSLQHEAKQLPKLQPQPPEVFGIVVVTTGGNDIIHDYGRSPPREGAMYGATLDQAQPWIAGFELRLGVMLQHIDACFPGGCLIFVATIYDPTDGVGDIATAGLPAWPAGISILHAYNRVIAKIAAARPNVRLVNIHDAFLGHGIHCTQFWRDHYRADDPHYWYYYNLEDPNDRGYDAIRRLFLNEIAASKNAIGN